jgi:hypothetical protein
MIGSGAHPASYNRLGANRPGYESVYTHLMPRQRNVGLYHHLLAYLHGVVLGYIIKCWDAFTLSGSLCPFIRYMPLRHGHFDQAQVACSKRASGVVSSQRMACEVEEIPKAGGRGVGLFCALVRACRCRMSCGVFEPVNVKSQW